MNSLIKGKHLISLCISKINDDVSHHFITELNDLLSKMNSALFVYATISNFYQNSPVDYGEASIFELIDYENTDVIIIYAEMMEDDRFILPVIEKARAANVPVITIGRHFDGCSELCFDYEAGFETVVRHAIEHHKPKKPHFIAGAKGNDFSEKRVDIFKKVISENGFSFDESMVSYGDFWSVPTEDAINKLVRENNIPDAVICANDTMAIAAQNALKRNGLRIPEDVMVTGFDGIDEILYSKPQITSCKCSYKLLAEKSVELINGFLDGETIPEYSSVIPEILIYSSCGCDNSENISFAERIVELNNRNYRFQEENRTLSELCANMQLCETPDKAVNCFRAHNVVYDMCCILTADCTDEKINPLQKPEGNSFGEELYLIYDSDLDNNNLFTPGYFKRSDVIPGLETQLDHNAPLIFVALSFLDIPLGFLCFHYHNDDIANYTKIAQNVTMFNNAVGGMRNIRHQRYRIHQVENIYRIDTLTGLFNRRGFTRSFNKLVETLTSDSKITVVMADLDDLKKINDIYGHGAGDNAIRMSAKALKNACPEGSLCTRFGGDEMLAVINGEMSEEEIRSNFDGIINEYNANSNKPYKISASLGIFTSRISDGIEFESLIKKSDELMYIDKQKKKNGWVI